MKPSTSSRHQLVPLPVSTIAAVVVGVESVRWSLRPHSAVTLGLVVITKLASLKVPTCPTYAPLTCQLVVGCWSLSLLVCPCHTPLSVISKLVSLKVPTCPTTSHSPATLSSAADHSACLCAPAILHFRNVTDLGVQIQSI
ncbi:hypothetical protein J6590_044028 [Homalodisca vitripennis]|nr:hypothetical protein J6590_044028 [Homalodisca vitripennis]